MVVETIERNNFNSRLKAMSNNFNQRRIWVRCPRCIGGNMYQEHDGEYVCLHCGCSYYPDKATKTLQTAKTE